MWRRKKLWLLVIVLMSIFLSGCNGNPNSISGDDSKPNSKSVDDSSFSENFDNPLVITAQPFPSWRYPELFIGGWLEITVENYGNGPIDVFGEIRAQSDDGKWYVSEDDNYSMGYLQETLNPGMSLSFDTNFQAPEGTRFVRLIVFQATDDGTDGILAEGEINFVIPG